MKKVWLAGVLACLATLAVVKVVLAHSWYPENCCAESHCHPVPCDQMIEQPNGDVIFDLTVTIPAKQVKPSPDRRCHVCIIAGSGVCAFIQYGA